MKQTHVRTTLSISLALAAVGFLVGEESCNDLAAKVDRRIEEWKIKPEERPLDRIGWAADIRDALRLSKEHNRPVMLFTHDGRMGIGRC